MSINVKKTHQTLRLSLKLARGNFSFFLFFLNKLFLHSFARAAEFNHNRLCSSFNNNKNNNNDNNTKRNFNLCRLAPAVVGIIPTNYQCLLA